MSGQLSLGLGRKPRPCRNVVGEPKGAATVYCGAPAAPDCDYCPACRAILFRGRGPVIAVPHEERIIQARHSRQYEADGVSSVDAVMKRRNARR
jgi:hypothetical protein